MLLQVTEFLKAIGLPGAALPPDSRRRMLIARLAFATRKATRKRPMGEQPFEQRLSKPCCPTLEADPVERTPAAAERVPKMATRS